MIKSNGKKKCDIFRSDERTVKFRNCNMNDCSNDHQENNYFGVRTLLQELIED